MRRALMHYRPILLCAWQQHRNLGSRWLLPTIALLALAGPLALGLALDWRAASLLAQGLLSLGLLTLWALLFNNLRRQNHPTSAHLVPHHLERLRSVAVLAWFSAAGACALLLGLAFGDALAWGLGSAVLMLAIASCIRWPGLWVLGWFIPLPLVIWRKLPLWGLLLQGLQTWYAEQPATMLLAAGVLLPWALSRLLQGGGNAHFKSYQGQETLRKALSAQMRGSMVTPKTLGPGGFWLARLFSWPRPLWMRYVLARANGSSRSVMARLDLVTLGNVHWNHALGAFSLIFSIAAVVVWITQSIYGYDWHLAFNHSNIGLHIGIISMAVTPLFGLASSLYNSRREQALLILLPGMPRGQALNAALSRRLLIQFAAQWLLALLLVQHLFKSASLPAAMPLGFSGAHILLALLPMSSLLLRDWARQGPPTGNQAALLFLLAALVCAGMLGLQWWLALSLWPFALASVTLSLVLVSLRWRRWVRGSPQAMPVGRLAA